MEKSSKRGKIPQQDWPAIIKRYEAGETLASIARTYDCSPPAISYILSRSRARDATAGSATQAGLASLQAELAKNHPNDGQATEVTNGTSDLGEAALPIPAARSSYPVDREGSEPASLGPDPAPNGTLRVSDKDAEGVVAQAPGHPDDRHIQAPVHSAPSLNGNSLGTPGTARPLPQPEQPRHAPQLSLSHNSARRIKGPHHGEAGMVLPVDKLQELVPRSAHQIPASYPSPNNDGSARSVAEPHRAAESVAFIDRALRKRVDDDISAFLEAFDAALANDTIESRFGLRQATDRLLRAGARTRIELERLEARVPLPARDTGGHPVPHWRLR